MFWKKTKKIDIEIKGDDEDNRAAFRIKPEPKRPLILTVQGNSYPITNISGTGCCFRSHQFAIGASVAGTIRMPSEDIIFPVSIRVVARQRDLCRCEFSKISASAENAIHTYVLQAQKNMIRP